MTASARRGDLYYEGDESIIERLIEAVEDLRSGLARVKARCQHQHDGVPFFRSGRPV